MKKKTMKEYKKIIVILGLIITVIAIIQIISLFNKNKHKNEDTQVEEYIKDAPEDEEFIEKLENDINLNVSNKLNEPKTFDSFAIENIQLTSKNLQTQLLANVRNVTKNVTEETLITVTLYDQKGNEIVRLDGVINPLRPGESTQLNINSSLNYANAYDYSVEIK